MLVCIFTVNKEGDRTGGHMNGIKGVLISIQLVVLIEVIGN